MLQELLDKTMEWKYTLAWAVILLGVLTFEVFTIFNKEKGDTLSEQVWSLKEYLKSKGPLGQAGLVGFVMSVLGFFGWMAFHFFGNAGV